MEGERMNDYKELIELLSHPTDGRDSADIMIAAADAIEQIVAEYNELDNAHGELFTEYKMTNADRIRSMSDEELAEFLCNFRSCNADEYICEGCKAAKYCRAGHVGTIGWLQQPAEEADNG